PQSERRLHPQRGAQCRLRVPPRGILRIFLDFTSLSFPLSRRDSDNTSRCATQKDGSRNWDYAVWISVSWQFCCRHTFSSNCPVTSVFALVLALVCVWARVCVCVCVLE
ncbi:unnamed protein product, partial [Ixodes pacificus]